MEDKNLYQEIPKEFYSFETNQPFDRCIECNTFLLDGKEYFIEKAIRKYRGYSATDTIFDYAICVDCAMKMRNEFSKESMTKLDAYFQSGILNIQQAEPTEKDLDMDQCLGRCIIKNQSLWDLDEYQIYAYCKGDKLFKGIPPYMVGGPAIDDVLPLLSNPTTDFLNGFYDRHFKPDPSLMEPTPSPRLVFI